MGRDWAKGRTAADDPRIARAAAAHRGMTYVRHLDPKDDRRYPAGGARTLPLEWSDTMAYVVGLMATDGCLITRGHRHLSFDTGDEQLVRTFLECLGRPLAYLALATASGGIRYKAQFSDVAFYQWLQAVGLTPRKSLVLGAISVPSEYLASLVRGLLDGDGTIYVLEDHPTRKTYPEYRYERLWTRFTSASSAHLEWLQRQVSDEFGLGGYLRQDRLREGRHPFYTLKYGNRASVRLLSALYADPSAPCLERKRAIWLDYAVRHGLDGVK